MRPWYWAIYLCVWVGSAVNVLGQEDPRDREVQEWKTRDAEQRLRNRYQGQEQDELHSAPVRQVKAIEDVRYEIRALRHELAELRKLLERLLVQSIPPAIPTQPVQTRKVWKQVRPPIQIEGMIDDGYELVTEPVKKD